LQYVICIVCFGRDIHYKACSSCYITCLPPRDWYVFVLLLPFIFIVRLQPFILFILMRPVAQLYGQVRMLWNQRIVTDCSLSHPAGHKRFTCSHCVCMYHMTSQSRLVLDAFFCLHFCACIYDLAEFCMDFSFRGVSRASCCLTDGSTGFCDMFVSSSS